ncbi:MAG: hypothetical protein JWS10_3116 [Cypionkella sp.]|uniref:hypothetical protein n=1 Tax=Cypionkella sp. TaxID=2811411 RepID=UPI0026188507|nr:hypothetical protein [Cypionkella sp.]MDB5660501.1 hypothetical protein [Cypionkella sp.]
MLIEDVATDLTLEQHPMVVEVRHYLARGYLLRGSRGFGQRNGYHSIDMFTLGPNGTLQNLITIKLDGACKHGWPIPA